MKLIQYFPSHFRSCNTIWTDREIERKDFSYVSFHLEEVLKYFLPYTGGIKMAGLPASAGLGGGSTVTSRMLSAAAAALPMKVALRCEGEKLEVRPLTSIVKEAEWLGVPFNCKEGICGHCRVKVIKGDNLTPFTEQEKAYFGKAISPNKRLACQLKLTGDAEIERISLST